MSGIIDETLTALPEILGGAAEVTGAVLAGGAVVAGTAVVAVGAAALAVAGGTLYAGYKAGEFAVEKTAALAKAVYQMDKEATARVNEFNRGISENVKRLEQQLLEIKMQEINADKIKQDNHLSLLKREIKANINIKDDVLPTTIDELTEVTEKTYHLQTIKKQLRNILLNVEIENQDEILHKIEESLVDKKYNSISELYSDYDSLIELAQNTNELIEELRRERLALYEDIDVSSLFIQLSFEENSFIKLLLRNDLQDLFEINKEDEELKYNQMIQEVLANALEEYSKLQGLESDNLHYYEGLMDSIIEIIDDEAYKGKSTYELIEDRTFLLKDHYRKEWLRNEDKVKQLDELSELALVNIKLREQLNMQIRKFDLTDNLEDVIFEIGEDNVFLYGELQKLNRNIALQLKMKELLAGKDYKHFATKQEVTDDGIVLDEYYEMKNGVLLRIRTDSDNNVISHVSGVELPGNTTNKKDILDSQKRYCSDYDEIREELIEAGFELELENRFEPHEDIAVDVFDRQDFTPHQIQKIRDMKSKVRKQKELKRRYMS